MQFVAVLAAVFTARSVYQAENLVQVGFCGGDTAGILAANHVFHLVWQHQLDFPHDFFVLNHVYGDVWVDEAQHGIIYVDDVVDFDDVLFAQALGRNIHNQGNSIAGFIQSQPRKDSGAASCTNMVNYQAVFDGVYAEH